jgi:hypothetical protein
MPMHTTETKFAEAYRKLAVEDIAALYADIDSLTEEARSALLAETRQRGLDEAQLQKVHAVELRREGQFDRLESLRRKKLAWGKLPTSPREWIFAAITMIATILIFELISRHH